MKIDAPRICIPARAIDILKSPEEFYADLKKSISNARTRIFLATLYIGSKEAELVQALQSKLEENKDIKVHILSDGIRGTREFPKSASTASLLSPLVSQFPTQVTVSLYQTPAFTGAAKLLLPKRFNEACGLQHMKLYGVDDEIILSGANLSNDYFTNRQDRYIRIRDRKATQLFWNIFEGVADVSFTLKPNGQTGPANFELEWPHRYSRSDINSQKERLRECLEFQGDLNEESGPTTLNVAPGEPTPTIKSQDSPDSSKTFIYPLVQFSPFGIGNEQQLMTDLCSSGLPYTLTAGYFNIAKPLKTALLGKKVPGEIIVAAPEANGFFESKGLSKNVPGLYSLLADRFAREASALKAPVHIKEWKHGVVTRGGWSYHAKGIWLRHRVGANPFLTVIGSSNYTERSYKHDMEAGAIITTDDSTLQQKFQQELDWLEADTKPLTSSPPATRMQRVFVKVFGDRL